MTTREGLLGDLPESFVTKVRVSEAGCWEWQGTRHKLGYGYYWRGRGMRNTAYSFTYEFFKGPVPEGLELDHLCRNPCCCNPDHLEAVTHRENMLRGNTVNAKHAAVTHCPQGHPYDKENTYWYPRGSRDCKKCQRERVRRWNAKNPERAKAMARRYYWRNRERISERRKEKRRAS